MIARGRASGKRLATPRSVDANPHARREDDTRTPKALLDLIEASGREVAAALVELRKLL